MGGERWWLNNRYIMMREIKRMDRDVRRECGKEWIQTCFSHSFFFSLDVLFLSCFYISHFYSWVNNYNIFIVLLPGSFRKSMLNFGGFSSQVNKTLRTVVSSLLSYYKLFVVHDTFGAYSWVLVPVGEIATCSWFALFMTKFQVWLHTF